MHARLRDALAELVKDLMKDSPRIEFKDYGFKHFLDVAPQEQLAEVLNEIIAHVSHGSAMISSAPMAMVVAPRTGLYYFKLAPAHGSAMTELMPPVYFSISKYEVQLHQEAAPQEVEARLANTEGFEYEVDCLTAGERQAVQLEARLLEKVRTLIAAAIQKEYGHGLTFRLESAARIAGIKDYHQLRKHLDELRLPKLCAVLVALGAEDELDYI